MTKKRLMSCLVSKTYLKNTEIDVFESYEPEKDGVPLAWIDNN